MKIQNNVASTQQTRISAEAKTAVTAEAKTAVTAEATTKPAVFRDEFRGIREGGCIPPGFPKLPPRDFPRLPPTPGPFPIPPKGEKTTLNLKDIVTGSRLRDTLSSPLNSLRLAFGKKDQTLTRGQDGLMRGPEGQPLVTVKLRDGNTAYVDPNTNQYYLTNERECRGHVKAMGPLTLPPKAQFSNSHFSDADVRALQRYANGGGIFPRPLPLPMPGPKPIPLPERLPGPFPKLPEIF